MKKWAGFGIVHCFTDSPHLPDSVPYFHNFPYFAWSQKNPFIFSKKKFFLQFWKEKKFSFQKFPKKIPNSQLLENTSFEWRLISVSSFIRNFLQLKSIISNDIFPLKIWLKFKYLKQKPNLISFDDILIVKESRKEKGQAFESLGQEVAKEWGFFWKPSKFQIRRIRRNSFLQTLRNRLEKIRDNQLKYFNILPQEKKVHDPFSDSWKSVPRCTQLNKTKSQNQETLTSHIFEKKSWEIYFSEEDFFLMNCILSNLDLFSSSINIKEEEKFWGYFFSKEKNLIS